MKLTKNHLLLIIILVLLFGLGGLKSIEGMENKKQLKPFTTNLSKNPFNTPK